MNIKYYREKIGLTQQQLADKVGIGLNHMGKIEVMYSRPSLDLVIRIASGLNITVSELTNFKKLI